VKVDEFSCRLMLKRLRLPLLEYLEILGFLLPWPATFFSLRNILIFAKGD